MNNRIYEDKEDLENEERLIQIANLNGVVIARKNQIITL